MASAEFYLHINILCISVRECNITTRPSEPSARSTSFLSQRSIDLKSIGGSAFRGSGLTSIHLPSSLESIGDWCFYKCTSLTSVEFGSDIHLKSIGNNAFGSCPNLTMVKIHQNFGFKDRFPKSVRFEVVSS